MFVAINYITCSSDYRPRFEELFARRAGAIDSSPGFVRMKVLKPTKEDERYLIVSEWNSEQAFKSWSKSDAFAEGHKRGFADLAAARERGDEPPMRSEFRTYDVISE